MIEKLQTWQRPLPNNPVVVEDMGMDNKSLFEKINELVDAVNKILAVQEQYATTYNEDIVPMLTPENEEPEPDQYKSITYMSDGHIKKFYGHDSIVELEVPLPQGTRITIKSITKGGNNE